MSKVKVSGNTASFKCPGCKLFHSLDFEYKFSVSRTPTPSWGFNGDVNKPTFTPSVLAKTGHYASGHKHGEDCWCTYYAENPEEERDGFECGICHSFVTDGRIQFLSDCTHELANQTVELPDYPV